MSQSATAPTFSVIMPVYNHAEYLAESVRSVREQSDGDWELIVVDDGSTDGSGELADRLAAEDGRIRVIHQANAGPAAARNAGLALARGAWLAYLDSDDVSYPGALAAYRRAIAEHPEEAFFYGYRHRLDADASITELPAECQDAPTGLAELFGRMYLSHLCVCYRRELLDRAGPYDDRLRTCEDYELYLRIGLHTRLFPLGVATGLRRRHGRNISRASGFSRFQEAEVLRRFIERLGGAGRVPATVVARRLARLYRSAGRNYFAERRYAHAAAALRCSLAWRFSLRVAARLALTRLLRPVGRTDGPALPRL